MNAPNATHTRARLTILGAVQGVGFRPSVYRLAKELKLAGWVNNSSQGVKVEVEGMPASVETFLVRLEREKPPRAFIQSLETTWLAPAGYREFEIRASDTGGAKSAFVLPDIATCPECLREIFDPGNRRYLYPFTNCTHCGPRFSIIEALPYDRPNTSMKEFAMCDRCLGEYENPLDRRFHAQPNACPDCGPQVAFLNADGGTLDHAGPALARTVAALRDGAIVAVKGIGGFLLMAEATNDRAVRRLRERRHREEKPFALMSPSVEAIRAACLVSDLEERALRSPEAPVVLLKRHGLAIGDIAPSVAPGNPCLGVMLPYTPLHHLLLGEFAAPVVATSGNLSDEPICIDNDEAVARLGGLADFLLVHNRRIVRHVDDSVIRVMLGRELVMRRARGYAPLPVSLPRPVAPTLAVGAHLKNTVALAVGKAAFVSQHIGDLETEPALRAFRRVIADFERLYETSPAVIAADAHPDYLSTKAAEAFARESGARLVRVQHHHAHVLACMAENELTGPVLGVAWDGTGFGLDGTIWGGEFLRVDASGFERAAHFRTFPLPGGEAAVREPRRCALGVLWELFGEEAFTMTDLPPIAAFTSGELPALRTMLRRGLNAPRTSSAGRLFDAVAGLVGLRQVTAFEGQSAMSLEFGGTGGAPVEEPYPFLLSGDILDWAPGVHAMIDDVRAGVSVAAISARFHIGLAAAIVEVARHVGERSVVLTGGCFQNELLTRETVQRLLAAGFAPAWHQRIPPNDGGIALGQIVAANQTL